MTHQDKTNSVNEFPSLTHQQLAEIELNKVAGGKNTWQGNVIGLVGLVRAVIDVHFGETV